MATDIAVGTRPMYSCGYEYSLPDFLFYLRGKKKLK